ncbi:MAG: hypothetical protein J5535_04460 [Firmicutes bacterium]|nr:hypothetical protein [Bacillota bacterium]
MEGTNGFIVILCLVGIVVSILLNYKWNVNMGVTAFVFALIIGVLGLGLRTKNVVAMFPTSVYFQVMCLSLFFGWGVVNGTMKAVADKMLWASRKHPWMIVFAITAIGFILGFLGCVPPAAGAILAVMAFTVAVPSGVDPRICAAIGYSANAGSFVAWGASGGIINGSIKANGYEAEGLKYTWQICGLTCLVSLIVIVIFFFIYKGYNIKKVEGVEQKPADFTPEQKRTLYVIAFVVFFAVVPGVLKTFIGGTFLKNLTEFCDMQTLCLIGFLICKFLNLADQKKVVMAVPWNTLLLLAGISTLMAVATKAGAVDIITGWLGANVSAKLLPLFMCLLGGFLSAFSGGITVVFPMVAPMVPALVAATGGAANPMLMFLGTLLGAHFTAMSPFSTGGAVFLGQCRDEAMAKKLVVYQLVVCAVALIVGMIVITVLAIF